MSKALLFAILLFSHFIATANNVSWQAPLAKRSLLLDIDKVSDTKLVAVGEYGHILLSNNGEDWRQTQVPTQATLTSLFFIDELNGWAVGHDAIILHTSDGGETWHQQYAMPALEKPLFDVVFKDKLNGIAIGAYGLFLRTIDGGKTWQQEFHESFLHPDDIDYLNELKLEDEEAYLDERSGILPHFNRIKLDGVTLYLVGEIGLVAKSHDFGKTWLKLDDIYHGSFFDIARTPQGNLLICGLRGHIFRSFQNSEPWQTINTNSTALLSSIVTTEQRIFVLGNNGLILESVDDGKTFKTHIQADGISVIDGVWFNQQLLVVTDAGIKAISLSH